MKTILLAVAAFLFVSAPAWAQGFGQDWLDEISREMQADRGPLDRRPATTLAFVGVSASFDDNIFLDTGNEVDDTPIVGMFRGRTDYADTHLEAALDAMVSWTEYFSDEADRASDHQERIMGRIRYADAIFDVQLADIFRNESDATDVVFSDKIERIVNDTFLRTVLHVTPTLAAHADGKIQLVRFDDIPFNRADNWNARASGGLAYSLPNGLDLVAEAGVFHLDPMDRNGPPETDGFFARGGIRGEITPTLYVSLLGGVAGAESEDHPSLPAVDDDTFDAHAHVRWEATENLTLHADYTRVITYTIGMGLDPFQTVDRYGVIGEYRATQYVGFRGRFQYDDSESALKVERNYFSTGGRIIWYPNQGVAISIDVTWRTGEIGNAVDYENIIVTAGLLLSNF